MIRIILEQHFSSCIIISKELNNEYTYDKKKVASESVRFFFEWTIVVKYAFRVVQDLWLLTTVRASC